MTDRRPLEAAIHRQLALVWSAGATAARQPDAEDPIEVSVRVASRQRIIDDAAYAILRSFERKER